MRIPKSFRVGGRLIKVSLVDFIEPIGNNTDLVLGTCEQLKDKIQLVTKDVSDNNIEEIFYHEVVHLILLLMGEPKATNEKFVDIFARYLHQIIKTSK